MAENNDVDDGTVAAFNDQFGLPPVTLTRVLVDGTDPGLDADHSEAFLDIEWGHAVAPKTPIYFYIGDFLTTLRGRSPTIFVG
jgi:subtilase family serine protease